MRRECLPMKPSSPGKSRRIIDRAKARNCALLNLAATPGLGSLSAGRISAGIGQLILSVGGCALFIAWFIQIFSQYYGQISGNVEVKSVGWMGIAGGALFVVAWIWSLLTSLNVSREARQNEIEKMKEQITSPPKL